MLAFSTWETETGEYNIKGNNNNKLRINIMVKLSA